MQPSEACQFFLGLPLAVWLHRKGSLRPAAEARQAVTLRQVQEWAVRHCGDDVLVLLDEVVHPQQDSWERPLSHDQHDLWSCISKFAAGEEPEAAVSLSLASADAVDVDRLSFQVSHLLCLLQQGPFS